jgi:hypothetical protein
MMYFVVYKPGKPATWHITSSAGFYDIATTPIEALSMIGIDAEKQQPGTDDVEFSVRWINTPADFVAPGEEDLPAEISPRESSLLN